MSFTMTNPTQKNASAVTTTSKDRDERSRFRLRTHIKAGGLTLDQLHASMANNLAKQNVTDHH